jgi:hypothetical protein
MRGLWLLSLCLPLGLPALAVANPELDVPGLESTELLGDALVWEDAKFFLEPYETGPHFHFDAIGRRDLEAGRVVPVRIVDATMRALVEIELAGRPDCTMRTLVADPRLAGVRLFVRRSDLAPVLTRPYAEQHGDGTRIRLAPGVPVLPTAANDYIAALRLDRVRLPIPHASVGWTYKPNKIVEPEPPAAGKLARINHGASIELGGASVPLRSTWLLPQTDRRADVRLVTLSARCVELVGQVAGNAIRPNSAPRATSRGTVAVPEVRGPQIPTGAPIATASGREVGVAAAPIAVSSPTGETACFDARFTLMREEDSFGVRYRSVKLCAPAALVER